MRTKGTEQCSELMEVDVSRQNWEKQQVKECAKRFEQKIANDLQMAFRMFAGVKNA